MENASRRRVFSVNFDQTCDVIFMVQNSIDQAVSQNKRFLIYQATAAKNYLVCHNTAQEVKLKVHVLQLLTVLMLQDDVTPTRHGIRVARQNIFVMRQNC